MKFFTAILLFPLCCSAHGHERVIAVSGYGEVSANPDTISITFELSERTRASIGEAKSALDELSSRVASALIAIGVQETDIRAPTMRTGEYQVQEKDKEPYVVRYASRSIKVIVRGVESYCRRRSGPAGRRRHADPKRGIPRGRPGRTLHQGVG